MTKHPDERLPFFEPFPTFDLPNGRRMELERLLKHRRGLIGNAVSNGAVLTMCAFFALSYGAFSAFAWITDMPTAGVLFSILSAGMIVACVRLGFTLKESCDRIPEIPARLRREAETEAAIAEAALDASLKSLFWNDMARDAKAHVMSEPIVKGLLAQRAAIERKRADVIGSLERYRAATAPKPAAVPPPDPWGHVETIDLSAHTDS